MVERQPSKLGVAGSNPAIPARGIMSKENIEKLIKKIIEGSSDMSKEDLQLYVNNAKEIERRLKEIYDVDRV